MTMLTTRHRSARLPGRLALGEFGMAGLGADGRQTPSIPGHSRSPAQVRKDKKALQIRPSPGGSDWGLTDSPDAEAGGLNGLTGLTGLEEATTAEADTSCGPERHGRSPSTDLKTSSSGQE